MSMILDALKRSQRDTLAIRQDREVAVDDSPVTHGKSGASTTSLMLAVGLVIVALLAALLVLQLRPTAPPLASRFEDPSESTIPVPPAKDVTAVEQAPNSIATVRQKMVARIYLFIIQKFKVVVRMQPSMTVRKWNLKWEKARKGHVLIRLCRCNLSVNT